MAVVKISELPAMQTIAGSDILPIVDTSETETKKVTKQMLLTDIDASEVQIGQLTEASQINDEDYLIITQNGTNKKISKANAKFASGDEVYVGDTEPTGEDADSIRLWVEPSEDSIDAQGTDIVNQYSLRPDKAYSCNYIEGQLMFDINSAIELTCHYSTSEIATGGHWIDGKPIYRKVINFGALPDTTTKAVAHNITNLDLIVNYTAIAKANTGSQLPIPYVQPTIEYGIYIYFDNTNITITTGYPRQSYTAYVILEYTKTTD